MKRIIKFIFSSLITLSLWFYFDEIITKIKAILFPKKTILKEIYNRNDRNNFPRNNKNDNLENINLDEKSITNIPIKETIDKKQQDKSWLDYIDYLFWGDQNFKERLKKEGIWNTLWKPYLDPNNNTTDTRKTIKEVNNQPEWTHQAVLDTDEEIKDTAIKSANHIKEVLSDYFKNNMSWIDYLIIQGFKILAILAFFVLTYFFISLVFKLITKNT